MRRSATICLSLLALTGCDGQRPTPMPDAATNAAPTSDGPGYLVQPTVNGQFKFLALGDSYTIGESVEPADRWPTQLASRLRSQGIDLADPVILARTGWTSDELLAAMDRVQLPPKNDLVALLIGVNDEFCGYPIASFEEHLGTLLHQAIRLAGDRPDHVMVLAIPDWGRTPYGLSSNRPDISAEIDHFNATAKGQTEKAGARWVDISAPSRQVEMDSALVASDGLHPSPKLYKAWTTLADPVARTILGK